MTKIEITLKYATAVCFPIKQHFNAHFSVFSRAPCRRTFFPWACLFVCSEVGKKLAQVSSITLLTGGFNGVPQLVARSFVEARKGSKTDSVYHLLPKKDSSRFQDDAPQSSDGTFRDAELGKTVYIGDSIKERELIVGRTFSICILIGGPSRLSELRQPHLSAFNAFATGRPTDSANNFAISDSQLPIAR